jgi:hypothetical protein
MRRDPRRIAFLIISSVLVAAALSYAFWRRSTVMVPPAARTSDIQPADSGTLARLAAPVVLFRNSDLGAAHGRVFLATGNEPTAPRYSTTLACERVHFAGGHGVCLIADRGFTTTYRAATFGSQFAVVHELPLPGIPSRVRLSPSGRTAGITVFVSGDSYASGSFSTRAILLDTLSGTTLGDLEQFTVTRDGQPFKAVDFNFWGITFADDRRFYATLQTGGRRYLVEADVSTRSARVAGEDVECPALSPDGTRLAFKKRETVNGRIVWHVAVRELATGHVTVLSETRSVDDQPEWLDDRRVLYALSSESQSGSTAVWVVQADGSGTPALFLDTAWSPAVVRDAAGDAPR